MRRRCTFLSSSRMRHCCSVHETWWAIPCFPTPFPFAHFEMDLSLSSKDGRRVMARFVIMATIEWIILWITRVSYGESIQWFIQMNAFKTQYLSFSADDPYPLSTPRFHCSCEDNASYQQSEMAKRKTLRKKNRGSENPGVPFCFPCLFCSKIVISYISTNMVCFVGTRELSWLERDANNAKWSDSPFIAQAD